MAIDKDTREALEEFGKRFAHQTPQMMAPMDDHAPMLHAIMDDIGMMQGTPLATVGTHLGTIIGGGTDHGIDANLWPRALMGLHVGDGMAYSELVTEQAGPARVRQLEYTEALREVCRAILVVVETCISPTVPNRLDAMRKYLEFLAGLISHAMHAAHGD